METSLNPGKLIYTQLSKVMAEIGAIEKKGFNNAQSYKFRGIDQFYGAIHPLFSKHGIFAVPEVVEVHNFEAPTKSGGVQFGSRLTVKYTVFASDGSSVSGTVVGTGLDHGDKASNKAMAAAHKYFLLQLFVVPTEDAVDGGAHSPEESGMPNDAYQIICVKGLQSGFKEQEFEAWTKKEYGCTVRMLNRLQYGRVVERLNTRIENRKRAMARGDEKQ